MMSGDPALIISLRTCRHRRSIGTNDRHLISWIHFLASQGSFGPFASFTAAALLGKESSNPGAVDEVACPSEGKAEK